MANTGKSLRTPLSRVRYLGSARVGAEENWLQHVTSVALIPLTIAFAWLVLTLLHKDYNGVRAELGRPLPAIVLVLFVLVGLYHMQIGLRAIILDYVHGHAREWALMITAFFAAAVGLACVYAVLRIGFV
ncbi:MAG: succinate dehydrogenase, hydrophobic membrane anchor protein [Roseiarcus sp.]|jgi:succinate dehydrogenase / fumarate reductase membrane anchor subunit